ncbi:MAG: ribonuclease D [Alphaproteobacteria bacterium]
MAIKLIECTNDLPADAKFPNGMAAIDTETLGLNVLRDRLCVVQIGNGQGTVWLVKFDGTTYKAPNLKKLLADKKITKIFHFARFDMATLFHWVGTMPAPVYCTKIASKLTRTYTDRHGLKSIVSELIGVDMDKSEQTSDWASKLLTEAQKSYAASDVIYLHELKAELDAKLADRGRADMAEACFTFLATRAKLDLAGWDEQDIFAH